MPVKIDMSSIEFSAIAQMAKDYEVLYDALEKICVIDAWTKTPVRMKEIAESALDRVTIKP